LEEVTTLLELGAFLRRGGQPRRARAPLAEALRLAETCGAARLAGRVRAELAASGGRRRSRVAPAQLTPRERRVAELAAAGDSDAAIACHLSVSVNTVRTHLKHVYTKLRIHSRRELMVAHGHARAPAGGAKDHQDW
jgi:DNA-binding CsgD family transcriptional regulator